MFGREADRVDGMAWTKDLERDPHHYRIIVSPEDGAAITDMRGFVRNVMGAAEWDLGTRLGWVAVIHEKGDGSHEMNRHAHVLLHAIDQRGRALVIARGIAGGDIRARAREEVTRILGPITERDLQRDMGRQVEMQSERETEARSR
jgi:type IV secretory pathway VirD2 relaxase